MSGILWITLVLGSAPLAAQQRIASLNLCTDLLLLELVAPERIASLTYWAADPELSYLAQRAGGIALNRSLAEEIVPLAPDLVLAGQFSDSQVISLLRGLGYRVEVMDVPLTLAGMREHLLAFGELVGEPEKAVALAAEIDRGLRQVAASIPAGARPLAAVYGPQGVSPGRDTLMDDLLTLTGYRNLAAEVGIESYGTLSLEELVRADPDVLVLDDLASKGDSIAHQVLRHPVLQSRLERRPVIHLPARWSVCVGPGVLQAARILAGSRP